VLHPVQGLFGLAMAIIGCSSRFIDSKQAGC